MYNIPTRIFTDLYLKSKRQHFRVFVYKSNFSYEIPEFRIQELFEPLFKEKWPFSWDTVSVSSSDSLVIGFSCMFYKWDQLLNSLFEVLIEFTF